MWFEVAGRRVLIRLGHDDLFDVEAGRRDEEFQWVTASVERGITLLDLAAAVARAVR